MHGCPPTSLNGSLLYSGFPFRALRSLRISLGLVFVHGHRSWSTWPAVAAFPTPLFQRSYLERLAWIYMNAATWVHATHASFPSSTVLLSLCRLSSRVCLVTFLSVCVHGFSTSLSTLNSAPSKATHVARCLLITISRTGTLYAEPISMRPALERALVAFRSYLNRLVDLGFGPAFC